MPKQRAGARQRGRGRRAANPKGNPFAALDSDEEAKDDTPAFTFQPSVLGSGSGAGTAATPSGAGAGAGAGSGVPSQDAGVSNEFDMMGALEALGAVSGGATAATSITKDSFREMAAAMAAQGQTQPQAPLVAGPIGLAAMFTGQPQGVKPMQSIMGAATGAGGLDSMRTVAGAAPDAGSSTGANAAWNFEDLEKRFSKEKQKIDAAANAALWEAAKKDAQAGLLKAQHRKKAAAESNLSRRVKARRKKMQDRARGFADRTEARSKKKAQRNRRQRRFKNLY